MKEKISLEVAFKLIKDCEAVIVNEESLSFCHLDEIRNNPENEWLFLTFHEADECLDRCYLKFIEENQDIMFDGTSIYMKDSEDDDIKLTLLTTIKFVN